MTTKKITVKNERVWVEIERGDNKSFTFTIGYHRDNKRIKSARYPKEYMPTIKDAKEFAQVWLDDYK